jgi:hypothetical protein
VKDSRWNVCEATFVVSEEAVICHLGRHCDPQDATAEHEDPSGLRWRYPEDEEPDE